MNCEPLATMSDLNQSERRLVTAMRQLGYGRFESLEIRRGEFVLDPWPTMIRSVKFGNATPNRPIDEFDEFVLKKPLIELVTYVRTVEVGMILLLEVRGGLPFSMEIAEKPVEY